MVHGHTFIFVDEPCLNIHGTISDAPSIRVKVSHDFNLLENFSLKSSFIPLSGREGQYLSKVPFNEADEKFSWGLDIKDVLTLTDYFIKQGATLISDDTLSIEKFKAFHHSVFIEFPFRKEERFSFFGNMAQEIPVYTITVPWDLKRLKEVYEAIISHVLSQQTYNL